MEQQHDETEGNPTMQRRTVVVGLAVAGAAVAAGALTRSEEPQPERLQVASLEPGTTLPGTEVRVVSVHPVTFGALPVVLETHSGSRYQVDVLARDPHGPDGVGNTERYSVYVSNQGDGGAATDEAQGLGAMALARILDERAPSLPPLLTMRDRESQHAGESFGVPLT